MTRREWMVGAAGLGALGLLPGWAAAKTAGDARLVVMLLRGALDGLAAVPPIGDRSYASIRGGLALERPGREGGALALDGFFGLHPALAPVHGWFAEGDLGFVHAVGLPYRGRSHFDAQNVLETGMDTPFASGSGWLNRAVEAVGGAGSEPIAMARTVPLVLRGTASVTSADPLRDFMPGEELIDRIADLYSTDPYLGPALETALGTAEMIAAHRPDARVERRDPAEGARVMGRLLAAADGPRIAVAESGGWDTHTGQLGGHDRLLGGLAAGLTGLREGLGEAWSQTAVLVLTEFGRTVRPNGSGGSDHGTGAVAMLAGGAIDGGKVLGQWPGLASAQLFEDRDLKPTTDVRAVLKAVLRSHLAVDGAALEDAVFPRSRSVAALW